MLESVTTFDGLFYAETPRGEYANLIKGAENVDFHLLVSKLASAKFEVAPGKGGGYTSYVIRMTDVSGAVAASFFLMWPEKAARGAYAPGQVEAFTALQQAYGGADAVHFTA